MNPEISIEYCPKCGWLLRAGYVAQEILTTFLEDVRSVSQQPAATNGTCTISIDGKRLFDRKNEVFSRNKGIKAID